MKLGLAKYLGVSEESIHLYWKGRVGLYAILRSMGIAQGDEVIIPAFTCVVVANAIIYCGAKPVYVDVLPESFHFNPDALRSAVSERTKLIIAQNTFGVPPDYETLEALCEDLDIPCIEDCTHGLGTLYKGERLPPNFVKASFYSFQWNKPLSAGLGGLVYCRDQKLNAKLIGVNKYLMSPSFKTRVFLSLLLKIRPIVDYPIFYWPLLRTYRLLSRLGLVVGSSSGEEISGIDMPKDFFMGMAKVQAQTISNKIGDLDALILKRKAQFDKYAEVLQQSPKLPSGHSALKFPVLVSDKLRFEEKAERAGVKLGDWMCSPIHPVKENWEKWHYEKGQATVAEWVSRHILNLQTDLSDAEMKRTIAFLKDNRSDILDWSQSNP